MWNTVKCFLFQNQWNQIVVFSSHWLFALNVLSVNTWSLHPIPFLKPAFSFFSQVSTASCNIFKIILSNVFSTAGSMARLHLSSNDTYQIILFCDVKVKRPLVSSRTMGQVYCTKWHISLSTKYTYIQGAHAPLCPCKAHRDKVLAAKQVGLYVHLNPPPLTQRGSWNVWVVNNYQSLSGALNV